VARTGTQTALPRRRGRVSTQFFNLARPSTIELPLDPAPIPNQNPVSPGPVSDPAANPDIGAVAADLNVDVDTLTKFMTAMKLVNGDNAHVIITPRKAIGRKTKLKAELKATAKPATQELANKSRP